MLSTGNEEKDNPLDEYSKFNGQQSSSGLFKRKRKRKSRVHCYNQGDLHS
jgi:hypothetical protein